MSVAIPKFVDYITRNNELQKQGEVPNDCRLNCAVKQFGKVLVCAQEHTATK